MAQTGDSLYNRYRRMVKPKTQPRQPTRSAPRRPNRAQSADAQRYAAQTRSQNEQLYSRWRAIQAQERNNPRRQTESQAPDPMARQARADQAAGAQNERANQAYADRMYAAGGLQRPDPNGRIFGVHYGPNWTRGTWTPPADWRMGKYADMQMTYDEYIRRRNAVEPTLQPGYNAWIDSAKRTPNQPHDIYSDWRRANPRPGGFYQTDQEWILRNNAAPTGKRYVPYGSSYEDIATQPRTGGASGQGRLASGMGGGGYGGWGDWGYGGGGGGGGGGYSEQPASFWNSFLNWKVLEVQGG